MCFWRASTARISGGQTKRAVNQMNAAKVAACAMSVRLMFMTIPWRDSWSWLLHDRQERIGEGEEHGQAYPDDERRVDQAEQQEHFRLQLGHELGLPRGTFQ